MKKINFHHKLEFGQVIPILVFGVLAMIALSALILDGGALLVNRRAAQNAADAGALAGARVLCQEENPTTAMVDSAIRQYTETENKATLVNWYSTAENVGVDGLAKGEIVVTAEVEHNSFFAPIFKLPFFGTKTEEEQNQLNFLTAQATAAAGCFPKSPRIVLPIAYECKPPVEGSVTESEDCDYWPLHWDQLSPVLPSGYDPYAGKPSSPVAKKISEDLFADYEDFVYIVFDSNLICGDDLICDFSDDIVRYQLASSQRGWLNLEGINPSTTSIRKWVFSGIDDIQPHTWLSFIQGNKKPGYDAIDDRIDQIVWIPVFNEMCDYIPTPGSDCWIEAHADFPSDTCSTGNLWESHTPYAHIVTFAPFFPTCIQMRDEINDDVYGALYAGTFYPGENCPGFDLAQEKNPDPAKPGKSLIPDNSLSLEGYFIRPDKLPTGEGISAADLGYYTVALTR